MNIMITGGAGFIGSALIRHIITHTAHRVLNVDKLTYAANLDSLAAVSEHPCYRFTQVDICDQQRIAALLGDFQPDLVIHLAAESHVDRSISGPSEFIQTNIVGTSILLEQVRSYWSQLPAAKHQAFRFHHVSTDEVYGDLPHPAEYSERPLPRFSETTPYAPSSPYSASKAASDHLVRAWYRTYGLPIIITNCSNNYGPWQYPEKLIPLFITNALAHKPLPIYGNGQQIRDWLYVEDHARALTLIAEQGRVGETYNIGGDSEKQNIEVAQQLCAILDELAPSDKHASYNELLQYVEDRPGHDMRYAIDASKLHTELGWAPRETFETGLRKTVHWYLQNLPWCQRTR